MTSFEHFWTAQEKNAESGLYLLNKGDVLKSVFHKDFNYCVAS